MGVIITNMELFTLFIVFIILIETTILLFKHRRPNLNPSKQKFYVDTSILMDGRILNIAKTGFITNDLIILKSVLRELQLLADGKDAEKRTRARAGLDLVRELERIIYFNVEIVDDNEPKTKVDDLLLKFTKENHGKLLTLDFNLIKVATAEKIETLNINDLALAIRNEFFSGEQTNLKITEKGTNRGQGIGYLKDGTMVVVDHATKYLNQDIIVKFTKIHETSAGKMIFAKIVNPKVLSHLPHHTQPRQKL